LILAGPVLLGCTFLTAITIKYILQYEVFTWPAAIMFGAIVSATDPVAVVAMLKELGASKKISTIIEGESLLNDGTAMVIFLVVYEFFLGESLSAGEIIGKFCQLSIGGPAFGIVCGFFLSNWMKRIHHDAILEVNITIFGSYLVFYMSMFTILDVSGILALVALGFYMNQKGKNRKA